LWKASLPREFPTAIWRPWTDGVRVDHRAMPSLSAARSLRKFVRDSDPRSQSVVLFRRLGLEGHMIPDAIQAREADQYPARTDSKGRVLEPQGFDENGEMLYGRRLEGAELAAVMRRIFRNLPEEHRQRSNAAGLMARTLGLRDARARSSRAAPLPTASGVAPTAGAPPGDDGPPSPRTGLETRLQAVRLADCLDWKVTPLTGKAPRLAKWQALPKPSIEEAVRWAREGNIGVRTGSASGIVVLDVDSLDGRSERDLGLPATVTVNTSRGHHYYFTAPERDAIGNSVKRVHPSVDVRGDTRARHEGLIDVAEALLATLVAAGVRGQQRDFTDSLDVNRAALSVLDSTRGPVLRRRWGEL